MRIAIADPPYLGLCRVYGHDHRPDCWDEIPTHRALFEELERYDGWAVFLHSPSLREILPLAPERARVGAWVKPFTSWKPGVSPAYAWEPVIYVPARKLSDALRVTDYVSESITLRRGFTGAKPERVTHWVLGMLGAEPADEIVDLFPGSGAVTRAVDAWRRQLRAFG